MFSVFATITRCFRLWTTIFEYWIVWLRRMWHLLCFMYMVCHVWYVADCIKVCIWFIICTCASYEYILVEFSQYIYFVYWYFAICTTYLSVSVHFLILNSTLQRVKNNWTFRWMGQFFIWTLIISIQASSFLILYYNYGYKIHILFIQLLHFVIEKITVPTSTRALLALVLLYCLPDEKTT